MQRHRPSYHKAYSHNTSLFQAFSLSRSKDMSNIGRYNKLQLFRLKQGITSEFPGFVPYALVYAVLTMISHAESYCTVGQATITPSLVINAPPIPLPF